MNNSDINYKVRSAAVSGTGRSSFKFDASTWAAIDLVAEQAGLTWVDWASRAIKARPHAKSMAAAVRAAVADALMAKQFEAMVEENSAGQQYLDDIDDHSHPLVGGGYYRLNDETLNIELEGARITTQDDCFEGFTLIVGYRDKSFGGNAFICIKNRLRDGLHLFIAQEEV